MPSAVMMVGIVVSPIPLKAPEMISTGTYVHQNGEIINNILMPMAMTFGS